MKKKLNSGFVGLLVSLLIILPSVSKGQSEKAVVKKYLGALPKVERSKTLQKYQMTAVYINRDLYGNFTGKTKVSGDYTSGLPGDSSMWNNVLSQPQTTFQIRSLPEQNRNIWKTSDIYLQIR
jgi:ABC-type oligopeptide transport system substrate-binding subunit